MDEVSRELRERSRRADPAALEVLLERHLPGLRAYVRLNAGAAVRMRESASDIVQSVVRELLEAGSRYEYRGEVAFRQWLYTAALRKIVARDRYWHAEKRDVRRVVDTPSSGPDDGPLLQCYQSFCSPSRHAVVAEELARIERACDQLPEASREIVLQSRILGLSHAEIAERTGRKEGAVRVQLHRALARLARILDESSAGG